MLFFLGKPAGSGRRKRTPGSFDYARHSSRSAPDDSLDLLGAFASTENFGDLFLEMDNDGRWE